MTKKIKITESQALRLKLINEGVSNPMVEHAKYCQKVAKVVDKIYIDLLPIDVEDVLTKRVDMDIISNVVTKIEMKVRDLSIAAYDYVNTLPEDNHDMKVQDVDDIINYKIGSVQYILMNLSK